MCSFSSASQRFFFNAETRAQIARCAMVSCGLLSDFRADCVLRYGLLWSIIGLSCRLRTALGSEDCCYSTFVQIVFCVMVSGWLLSDFRADCALRYGLWWVVIGHWCSMVTALGPLVGGYRTFVQSPFCVRVSGGRLSDFRADCVLR